MAELNLDEIQARADAATPGPWLTHTSDYDDPSYLEVWTEAQAADVARPFANVCEVSTEGGFHADDEEAVYSAFEADARFIAHAREDVPALIARVRELEAERDDARAEADRLGDRCAELEGLLAEALREPHPETGELRHRIRQALA